MNFQERRRTPEDVERLIRAIDEGAKHSAAASLTFVGFATYLGIVVGSIADEQLLRESTVSLPILNSQLPIIGFFYVIPWLLFVLHFNVLLNLYLLGCNLHQLNALLAGTERLQNISRQLWPFPFSHSVVGNRPMTVYVSTAVVWLGVLAAPVILLIFVEFRALPYHSHWLSWSQFLAISVDIAILIMFWPVTIMPRGYVLEWWRTTLGLRIIETMLTRLNLRTTAETAGCAMRPPTRGALALLLTVIGGFLAAAVGLVGLAQVPQRFPDDEPTAAMFVKESAIPDCLNAFRLGDFREPAPQGWRQLIPTRLLSLNLDELTLAQAEIKPEIIALKRIEFPLVASFPCTYGKAGRT